MDDAGYVLIVIILLMICLVVTCGVYRYIMARRRNQKFMLFEDEPVSDIVAAADFTEDVDADAMIDVDPESNTAQKLAMASPPLEATPKKQRLPLAMQFSAAAAAGHVDEPAQSPTAFRHPIQSNDAYIWPSKGGSAVPINVEWGDQGAPSDGYGKLN